MHRCKLVWIRAWAMLYGPGSQLSPKTWTSACAHPSFISSLPRHRTTSFFPYLMNPVSDVMTSPGAMRFCGSSTTRLGLRAREHARRISTDILNGCNHAMGRARPANCRYEPIVFETARGYEQVWNVLGIEFLK